MKNDDLLRVKLLRFLLELEEERVANLNLDNQNKYEASSCENEIREFVHFKENSQKRSVFSVIELSNYLGVSTDCIYTMVREKQVPHVRIRRRILFHKDEIDLWIQESTIKS
ncbi:helix-turn-helix domain-containing protein [Paenibacillus sp. R14(2021)]|uniref:helix-turn-helix domain-containing protein n=1 Tax=Paenibacillus sp. R14(2021) TaxID=2859228 RepID=UPI001C6132D4|nr:helix-turn-helix domain-containing protein [Paenibacillus sp. R14(2021)]